MCTLKEAIAQAGGALKAAAVCGVSVRAVYKWLAAGALPRTEYTGETAYVDLLSKEAAANGRPFDAAALRRNLMPQRRAA